jgi:SAM-dependent methyltransferase
MSQNWQALWEEAIKHSSLNRRRKDLSDKGWLNLFAEISLKKHGGKLNQTDPKKKAEFEAELNRLRRFVNKDSSVLDIGAGYGRVAVSLAREVRRMTVVEPAHPFMDRLKENARQEGANNMEFAEELWSDFQPQEKYDLVYSTWSPAVRDPAALMKMHEASGGYCALELTAIPLHMWDFFGQIYPLVTREAFLPPGNYLNILTTLYDHDIYANLETWGFENEIKYNNMQEAVDYWSTELSSYIQVTGEIVEMLRQFYQSRMNPDGSYTFNLKGGVSCMIWWKV